MAEKPLSVEAFYLCPLYQVSSGHKKRVNIVGVHAVYTIREKNELQNRANYVQFALIPCKPGSPEKQASRWPALPHLRQEVNGQVVVRVSKDALLDQEHVAPSLLDLQFGHIELGRAKKKQKASHGLGEG